MIPHWLDGMHNSGDILLAGRPDAFPSIIIAGKNLL